MVERRSDFLYSDDDLTIDRFDGESLDPSVVDLFDYLGESEGEGESPSPIARLKALVLSIDWEITDKVLRDFNEELASLRKSCGADPIKIVYLQALEKISKYIYRAQSNAHPDAVKLLPILFVDLEKIVQGGTQMSDDTKKQLLSQDVRRFNRLKAQIHERHHGQFTVSHKPARAARKVMMDADGNDGVMAINRLKALILGIDWEITEKDLMALRREVLHLEDIFASSRPKRLFLQGIGTLSAYIRNKKSNAHADAFLLLHDFFAGLEKVVTERLNFTGEKAVLLPLVSRFNSFKGTIVTTLSAEAIAKSKQAVLEEEAAEGEELPLQPAFADYPANVRGFSLEAEALSPDVPRAVVADIEKFFIEEDGPPLADIVDEIGFRDLASDTDNLFGQSAAADPVAVAPEVALRGINVESEADDDSEEAALPRQGGQLAPALSDEPVLPYGEVGEVSQISSAASEVPEEISNRLEDFFSTSIAPPSVSVADPTGETRGAPATISPELALRGVDVDVDIDNQGEKDALASPVRNFHNESEVDPLPTLAGVDAQELTLDEDEEEVEFSVDLEPAPALSFLPDDELTESIDAESSEITPALAGLDHGELPARSEFSEDKAHDDAVLRLETEELLAFFADKSPNGEAREAPSPATAEKTEVQVIDEVELWEAPQRLNDQQRDDFTAFLNKDDETVAEILAADETIDVRDAEEDVTLLSDSVDKAFWPDRQSAEAKVVAAGESAEPELPLSKETEVFDDGFFADGADDAAITVESMPERNIIAGLDSDETAMPVAPLNFARVSALDIDDESSPVAASPLDVNISENSTAMFLGETSLRDCVNALSDEINDDILDQSYREVRHLRTELNKQPLAEIYLQFIATIMQHIDQRRADASDEALPLLRQTFAHFEDSRRDGAEESIRQSFFEDTQAMLSWQQSLLQENGPAARSWL